MENYKRLREVITMLVSRIDDFLIFSEDLKNLPAGSYPDDDYLRLLVPIGKPIGLLHSEFNVMKTETASGPTLLHGDESAESRAVALLKKTLEQYWSLPCVAGSTGPVIISRFNVPLLVARFSKMRPRLSRILKMLSGPDQDGDQWTTGYFTVAELTRMRKTVTLSHSASTMTRQIDSEIRKGRIQRDGNKAMRLRMDLYTEWNTQLR